MMHAPFVVLVGMHQEPEKSKTARAHQGGSLTEETLFRSFSSAHRALPL